jgi:hypothetical protein
MFYEHELVLQQLSQAEVSLRNTVSDIFRKTLLLSAASYFEHIISNCMLEFASERTRSDRLILSLVKSKAIDRQYHTYFVWEGSNANKFFSLFGAEFKSFMEKSVKADENLSQSIVDFLELGNLRNQLVHMDFATFPLEKTADEIYNLYKSALSFVEILPVKLREFDNG